MALSLIPASEVERQFTRLRATASSSLDDFITYFDREWIKGGTPLSMWNCHDFDHRTNNVSEAYNRRFGSRVAKKHPNIWTFIQLLQNENARCEHFIIQLGAGTSSSKVSARTTTFQRRFEVLKRRFSNDEINAEQILVAFGLLLGGRKN